MYDPVTIKLFVALYVCLIVGMFMLFLTNFMVAWILFAFVFVAIFGGLVLLRWPHVIAAAFLAVSLVVLGLGMYGMYQTQQVGTWPTAPGNIVRSWFCTRTVNGEAVYSGPCIDYAYSVNGKTFEVSSIDTGEFSQQFWFGIPDKYKRGREIPVYYNPITPAVSRLSTDISARDVITVTVGIILATLSAVTLARVLLRQK